MFCTRQVFVLKPVPFGEEIAQRTWAQSGLTAGGGPSAALVGFNKFPLRFLIWQSLLSGLQGEELGKQATFLF